jgi:hypothetical protein
VRTLHGVHHFKQQRYVDSAGNHSYFLDNYESKGLREFTCFYSNRLSYKDLAGLLHRLYGAKVYRKSGLQVKVIAESKAVASYLHQQSAGQQLRFNFVEKVDIYSPTVEEINYFDDGVGVKRQKEQRINEIKIGFKSTPTVQTDVIAIGSEKQGYSYLSSAEANSSACSLEELIHLRLSTIYANQPLPMVAITDGASSIRGRLHRLFGKNVSILLDWYHLEAKIRQYLSRLGLEKQTKENHIHEMLYYLWQGQTTESLIYSDARIKTQKVSILEELQNYLLKHQSEICDYGKRQTLGKTIGSGRGEKANDQLIAHRQKKKSMSWSEKGSNALAILKSLEINQQWENYWGSAA